MSKRVGIIGGDLRQKHLVSNLQTSVEYYGNDSIVESDLSRKCVSVKDLLLTCNIILVPIPFSKDGKNIYTRYSIEDLSIDYFITCLKPQHIVLGGPFSQAIVDAIKKKGAKLIDLTSIETFKYKNAIPTSEGVIAKLIERTPFTIHGSRALVLGFGNCGKRISEHLHLLGADVRVFSVDGFEEKEIKKHSFKVHEKDRSMDHYHYIINTIPVRLFEEEILSQKLFIDITNAYTITNDKMIKMRGIPGRISPVTAGYVIGEIMKEVLRNVDLED